MKNYVYLVLVLGLSCVGCAKNDAHAIEGTVTDSYAIEKIQKGNRAVGARKESITIVGEGMALPPDKEEEGEEGAEGADGTDGGAAPSKRKADVRRARGSSGSATVEYSSSSDGAQDSYADEVRNYEETDRKGSGESFHED